MKFLVSFSIVYISLILFDKTTCINFNTVFSLKKNMDLDDEICKKSCRMYCRNRWNFGRPKFCDAKRIENALNGLHGDELFNMAIRLMWEKSSYVREGQYDYVLAVQRAIITNKLEGKLLHHTVVV